LIVVNWINNQENIVHTIKLHSKEYSFKPSEMDDNHPISRPHRMYPSIPPKVNVQPFAGRIGGNQTFTTSDELITDRVPDATGTATWRELLDLRGFTEWSTWQSAIIEAVGLSLQIFMTGLLSAGLIPIASTSSLGPVIPVTYAAIFQFISITLLVFTLGPVTGAHLNPLITIATFLTKLTSFPRMVLYVSFQCIGAIVAAFTLRSALGLSPQEFVIQPGCYVDSSKIPPDQVFALEFVGALFLLFLAFGLGLDPRNASTFGPSLGPFLIGLASAFTVFAGGVARPGFLGMATNPARCLGLMSASHRFTYHYIHWTADISAAA
jgi:glycerol uptake facilitator-like aquaporin